MTAKRLRVTCPRCTSEVATIPVDHSAPDEIECPKCGAVLRPPTGTQADIAAEQAPTLEEKARSGESGRGG